jgi:hypothetical protein
MLTVAHNQQGLTGQQYGGWTLLDGGVAGTDVRGTGQKGYLLVGRVHWDADVHLLAAHTSRRKPPYPGCWHLNQSGTCAHEEIF